MADVVLKGISKRFGGNIEAVAPLDLTVASGQFLVLVGPSGCGKSTLLRLVAGLEEPSAGTVAIDGIDVTQFSPAKRDIAMVFQSYALYPHMNTFDNMAYGLRNRGTPKPLIQTRILEAARKLELEALLDRKPRELSGGQRQRVAMGRAIVRQPKIFLFDEPLSNLDAKLRVSMRVEIKDLHRDLKITSIYVTHDQVEAMTLADRLVVMNAGRIEQVGTPTELYSKPATRFVASFLGSPSMSFLAPEDMEIDGGYREALRAASAIGLRPENLSIMADGDAGHIRGRIELVENLGGDHVLYVRLPSGARIVARVSSRDWQKQATASAVDMISLQFDPRDLHFFDSKDRRLEMAGPPQLY